MLRRSSIAPMTAALTIMVAAGGCPRTNPGPQACAGGDDPLLIASNRTDASEFNAGDAMDVFFAAQGGVFSELDVTLDEVSADAVTTLRVTVEATATGQPLANVRYFGEALPLQCNEADQLFISELPVGYDDGLNLADLDGVAVTVTGTIETARGMFPTTYDVQLRVTDF